MGRIANIKTVLGNNPLLWLWPQEMEGDGLSYAVNPDAGGESAQEWAYAVAPDQAVQPGKDLGLSSGHSQAQARLRSHLNNAEEMV